MKNHKAFKDNILPGDIILSRKITSPVAKMHNGVTHAHWEYCYLYLGKNRVLEADWWGVIVHPLDHYFNNRFDIGLFRVPSLDYAQQLEVCSVARKLAGLHPSWFKKLWHKYTSILPLDNLELQPDVKRWFVSNSMIARVYKMLDINLKASSHEGKMLPTDYDESPKTIRII